MYGVRISELFPDRDPRHATPRRVQDMVRCNNARQAGIIVSESQPTPSQEATKKASIKHLNIKNNFKPPIQVFSPEAQCKLPHRKRRPRSRTICPDPSLHAHTTTSTKQLLVQTPSVEMRSLNPRSTLGVGSSCKWSPIFLAAETADQVT